MASRARTSAPDVLIETLAEFRYELRQFLHFSECAASDAGLQPRQHQLLLQIAGAPADTIVTIAYAADRLCLRHHSVVELVDRSEREGLVTRVADAADRRRTILRLTAKGEQVLDQLAGSHARELQEHAPRLATALRHIGKHARKNGGEGKR